jgi:hypothetical protein
MLLLQEPRLSDMPHAYLPSQVPKYPLQLEQSIALNALLIL